MSLISDCLDHDQCLWADWTSPPGCQLSKMDATNFSLIRLCRSFGLFNCNYAPFSFRPHTVNLLLAVQEFMNRCIYFVLLKLLHFAPFSLSGNCTNTTVFAGYLLSCSLQHDGQPSLMGEKMFFL